MKNDDNGEPRQNLSPEQVAVAIGEWEITQDRLKKLDQLEAEHLESRADSREAMRDQVNYWYELLNDAEDQYLHLRTSLGSTKHVLNRHTEAIRVITREYDRALVFYRDAYPNDYEDWLLALIRNREG